MTLPRYLAWWLFILTCLRRSRSQVKVRGYKMKNVPFIPYDLDRRTRQDKTKRYFFTERIACIWNSMPPSTVDLWSLSPFKKTINHVHDIYLHDVDGLPVYVTCIVIVFFLSIARPICSFVIIVWYASGLWPFVANKSFIQFIYTVFQKRETPNSWP